MLGLIPSPRAVADAAANAFDAIVGDGLADLRPVPSTVIDAGPQRTVRRYEPAPGAPPVLLVPPLAAPALCFDLRRGCSLAEHLQAGGHRTYLVDYGPIEFGDRSLGLEHWIDEVVPRAIRAASADAGGEPVRIVGWCLGGILSLLALAADPTLPVASVALVASPFDFAKVPLVAPLRPIAAVTGGRGVSAAYWLLGGAPAPLVKRGYQLAGLDKYLLKPWTVLSNLDDRELLAQIEAVDAFMARMHAYPGRTFGQLYHRFFRVNDLADGRLAVRGRAGERTLDLAEVTVAVMAIAGRRDGIAPVAACHHVADLLPEAETVVLETAPGGHLGVLTGRAAVHGSWRALDAWLQRSPRARVPSRHHEASPPRVPRRRPRHRVARRPRPGADPAAA